MKGLFFTTVLFSFAATICNAQYDIAATIKDREYMIMDGQNPNFVHARQDSLQRLVLGILISDDLGDGIYELRGDTCIWLTKSMHGNDRILASLLYDSPSGKITFIQPPLAFYDRADTIGAYSHHTTQIFSKDGKLLAAVQPNGEVVSPDGKVYLRVDKVDRRLLSFFFVFNFLPNYLND